MKNARIWTAEAASNIALIKYMGKIENAGNRPTNSSLSYTLPHLKSIVQIEFDEYFTEDKWEPLTKHNGRNFSAFEISPKGKARFLSHFNAIKDAFGFNGFFIVRSANDFPSDCGLASSASSFAALTKASMISLSELMNREISPTIAEAAEWSRRGSGSSCRSYFSPWSIWTPERVSNVPELEKLGDLVHQVIVVNDEVKLVSSSEAHKSVTSSLLFAGRPQRADMRVRDFINALSRDRWTEAYEIAWAEFWDMHALFETSQPSFGYMTEGSIEVLRFVRNDVWAKENDGPLVTMDAGPNVHLLYRPNDRGRAMAKAVALKFGSRFKVISNTEGAEGLGQ